MDVTDWATPYRGQDADAQDVDAQGSESVERLRGRRRRSRVPLGAAEKAALKGAADAADARVKRLVLERRASSRFMAQELHEIKRRRLYEVHGFSSVTAYALDRGVADSASQVKSMIKLIERLQDQPGLREVFEEDRLDWTKAREVARELERRGNTAEALEELLADAERLTSRQLEDKYKRARGEPITRTLHLEVTDEVHALWLQRLVGMRVKEPTLTEDQAFARMVLQDAGEGSGARVVLHCAVPEHAPGAPGAPGRTKAQAALDAAAASVAVIVQTPGGPVAVPRARLVEALCCAEINDVRDGPRRVTRTVPPKIERYVRDRDQGRCKAPRCSNLGGLQVHHVGGRHVVGHDPDKMCVLCSVCHGMCHEGLLQIEPAEGGFLFTAADGWPPELVPFDRGVAVPALAPVPFEGLVPAAAPGPAAIPAPRPTEEPVAVPQAAVPEVAVPPAAVPPAAVPPAAVPQVSAAQAAVAQAAQDAVLALVVLEWKKREARHAVRQAVASLSSRGEAIDAGALTAEALRRSPGPSCHSARPIR